MLSQLPLPETQVALALFVFLFSFAYEDGATVLAATLGAAGKIDLRLGFISAFMGIWVGDMGLYALGAGLGRRAAESRWCRRFFTVDSMAKAEAWFAKRGAAAIVISRFLPGSRLPLYLAAGVLRLPVRWFGLITGACAAVWVGLFFGLSHLAPHVPWLKGKWVAALALSMLLAPAARAFFRPLRRVQRTLRKYRRWEFWPAWMFYPPVAAMCAWLAVRYRGLTLPTVANPAFRNGGIVGESKIEILQALMQAAPESVADGYLIAAGHLAVRLSTIDRVCREEGIGYPFVLKPNLGQRGAGFRLIERADDVEGYLRQVASDVILQRYVKAEKEAGIFYYRFPGQEHGEIFAITEKVFPVVIGDGERTFEQLLEADPRATLIAGIYSTRFPELAGRILAAGERIRLVEAGNHCQGCIFRDGATFITEALRARIDHISQSVPGFYIGRYDVRYTSDDELQRGENFQIIELNGAASEATNIYDERNSLWTAYSTLYRQWKLVYAIGHANRSLGQRPPALSEFLRDWKAYRAIAAAYPAAD